MKTTLLVWLLIVLFYIIPYYYFAIYKPYMKDKEGGFWQ